jgi:hypothetical protein
VCPRATTSGHIVNCMAGATLLAAVFGPWVMEETCCKILSYSQKRINATKVAKIPQKGRKDSALSCLRSGSPQTTGPLGIRVLRRGDGAGCATKPAKAPVAHPPANGLQQQIGCPVMKLASSEARNATILATSFRFRDPAQRNCLYGLLPRAVRSSSRGMPFCSTCVRSQ